MIAAIKIAIRLVSANKGVQCSILGGDKYVKDCLEKHKEKLAAVSISAFIKHHKNQFHIPEDEEEIQNPTVH